MIDFNLNDIIEADIKFGLFSNGECSHCGVYIECIDSIICPFCEIKLKKDTVLYKDGVNNLVQICQNALENELNTNVKINQIQIS